MRFLNDKFFRAAVVVFLLLMILPFIFSAPQPDGQNIDGLSEVSNATPIYKALNQIAHFYGFKKQDDKKSIKTEIKTSDSLKKIINAKKESAKELKQENISEEATKSLKEEENISSASGSVTGNQYKQENFSSPSDFYFSEENYPDLTQEEFEKLPLSKKREYLRAKEKARKNNMRVLDQNSQYDTPNNLTAENGINKNSQSDTSSNLTARNTLNNTSGYKSKKAKHFTNTNRSNINKRDGVHFFDDQNSLKGTFGQNYFSGSNTGSNKGTQDIYQIFGSSVKHLTNFQTNKKGKGEKKNKSVQLKTYKTEVFNKNTGKTETIIQKEEISAKDSEEAAELKKITANVIKDKDYSWSKQCNQDKCSVTTITKEEIQSFKEGNFPPHAVLSSSNDNIEYLDKSFEQAKEAANALPINNVDYPILEVIYKAENNEILRADKDSFPVFATAQTLNDKVQIPKDDSPIDFLDRKKKIYVVPEKDLYDKYKNSNMAVIFFPKFSAYELGTLYKNSSDAINMFNNNQKEESDREQNKNTEEIEQMLKN